MDSQMKTVCLNSAYSEWHFLMFNVKPETDCFSGEIGRQLTSNFPQPTQGFQYSETASSPILIEGISTLNGTQAKATIQMLHFSHNHSTLLLAVFSSEAPEESAVANSISETSERSDSSDSDLIKNQLNVAPLKILIAEDHPISRKLIQSFLMHSQHQLTFVSNGEEVIETLRKEPVDVILMDFNMPFMDGVTASNIIVKEFPEEIRPCMIAMSTQVTLDSWLKYSGKSFIDHLVKPIDPKKLKLALSRVAPRFLCENSSVNHQEVIESKSPKDPDNPGDNEPQLKQLESAMGREMLLDLIDLFLSEAPAQIKNLRQYLNQEKYKELASAVQRVSGSYASLAGKKTAEFLEEIEKSALSDNHENLSDLIDKLEMNLDLTKGVLEAFLQKKLN